MAARRRLLVELASWLVARFFVGNVRYRDLIQSRFPSLDCMVSEAVNHLCYLTRRRTVLMEPRYVFIEPTNTCNIRCIMCPVTDNQRMTRGRKLISVARAREILDANPKVRVVYLTNWGEPLLNPKLANIIELCIGRHVKVILTTNGTMLTQELGERLLRTGLSVLRFSMDGIGETYERVRGTRYSQVRDNIEHFIAARNRGRYDTRIELNVTYMPENVNALHGVEAEWSGKVDFIHYQGVISVPMLSPAELASRAARTARCRQLYRSVFYLTDGSVVPCCADFNGELRIDEGMAAESALDILNSAAARHLRNRHIADDMPEICSACTQYSAPIFPRRQSAIV